MKIRISFFLLLGLFIPLLAQAKYTIIEGKINQPVDDEVSVTIVSNALKQEKTIVSTPLNEAGEFKLAFQSEKTALVEFQHAFESMVIYVMPSQRIKMAFEADKMQESIQFEGDLAAENNYLVAFYKKFERQIDQPHEVEIKKDLTEYNFKRNIDQQKKEQMAFFQTYNAKNLLNIEFRQMAKGDITYHWAKERLRYAHQKKWKLHTSYFSFLHQLPTQEDVLQYNTVYLDYLLKRVDYEYQRKKQMGVTKHKNPAAVKYDAVKSLLTNNLRYYVQAQILVTACLTESPDDLESIYNDFAEYNPNEAYAAPVNKAYELSQRFSVGSPAPSFDLQNVDGGTTSLEDFNGKVVYMSFWASWCRPCLAQIEHVKALKKEFDSEEVAFVYVSVDEDEEAWRNAIIDKQIEGTQLLAGGGIKSPMAQDYNISGVPVYFMIDKDGNFASKPPIPSAKDALIERIKTQLNAD